MDWQSPGNGFRGMAAVAAVMFLAIGCGGSARSPERITAGRELYLATCAACHGPDARGMQMRGKNLHGNEFVKSLSDAELIAFLRDGRPATHPLNERDLDMPPRGGNPSLSDEELGLIGDYLRSLRSAR